MFGTDDAHFAQPNRNNGALLRLMMPRWGDVPIEKHTLTMRLETQGTARKK
jgi:hypothetical protein